MALHDFRCPVCGYVARDVNVPIAVGARSAEVYCTCGIGRDGVATRMAWIPAIGRMDFGPSSGIGFKAFTIEEPDRRGGTERIAIDSLHKLRQVEQDFEQRARNGEGRPLVWRDYANDRSNGDRHTLADNPADPHGVASAIEQHRAKVEGPVAAKGEAVTQVHGTL